MKKMQYGGKSVPGSTRIKKDGKWVSISDAEAAKMDADRIEKYKNSSKPVSILKGVNRRYEIGKPLTPMVLKKPTVSAPSEAPKSSVSAPKAQTSSVNKKPSSRSSSKPSLSKEYLSERKSTAEAMKKVQAPKAASIKKPSGPEGKGSVKNVQLSKSPYVGKKYSGNKIKRMENRAVNKSTRVTNKMGRVVKRMGRKMNKLR